MTFKEIPPKKIKEIKNGPIIQARKQTPTLEKEASPQMKRWIKIYKTDSKEKPDIHAMKDQMILFQQKMDLWKQ